MLVKFFVEIGSLFHAILSEVKESFPLCPRWSGWGMLPFFFVLVNGPAVWGGGEWWIFFHAAIAVTLSVIVDTEGMLSFIFVEMKLTSAANAVKTKQHFWELLRHPTRHLLGNLSFSQLSIDSFIDAMQWIFLSVGLMITY